MDAIDGATENAGGCASNVAGERAADSMIKNEDFGRSSSFEIKVNIQKEKITKKRSKRYSHVLEKLFRLWVVVCLDMFIVRKVLLD